MTTFGPNSGYVDELFVQYQRDPASVSEAWREFFDGYQARPAAPEPVAGATAPLAQGPTPSAPEGPVAPGLPADATAEPLRGVAARIVDNMEASLEIPTATSVRTIPVKLLEENRGLLNRHLAAAGRGKVSFTHLIGWAVVQAVVRHPSMNASYREVGGAPSRVRRGAINLALAIDVERKGERQLVTPCVRNAAALDFAGFVAAYEEIVARARQGKLAVPDFQDPSLTLTNPGMLGTEMSVPRLMTGQGVIVGVGAVAHPPSMVGMAPEVVSELGFSKVMTVTSTYDHRVIQGAESGAFLATVERLLLGQEGFYDGVFRSIGVAHEPVRWSADERPRMLGSGTEEAQEKQADVAQLIRVYRVRGHLAASLDPLGAEPPPHPDLELSSYGLTVWDLDRRFIASNLGGRRQVLPLREILDVLRETYSRHVGVEYMHIPDPHVRRWLQEHMEATRNAAPLTAAEKRRILEKLNAAEAFEKFLHTTYVGHKRFSLEGAETLIPMLDVLCSDAVALGIEEAVIGMAHRGRLNVLANVIGKSHAQIFGEFEGVSDPGSALGSGDVKYHLGASGVHVAPDGRGLSLTVAPNPSHLEAVNPVVEGMVRARQDRAGDTARERFLPLLVHGDAAFAGQGVVPETLNLSQLKGYRTGGTVHIVVNNQIGFTAGPAESRSSHYATDVAKMIHAPIFHVNGDQPEAAVRVVRMALAFRQALHRDVVVDLLCYRKWGHNEGDDPSYTHPLLYGKIEAHRSVRKLYTEQLLRRGDLDAAAAEQVLTDYQRRLEAGLEEHRGRAAQAPERVRQDMEATLGTTASREPLETGVSGHVLHGIVEALGRVPEGFQMHPRLGPQLARRLERLAADRVDWALAEALAFGSLCLEGTPVRLSGQDSGRGTFSQRHAAIYDHVTAAPYRPLANLREGQAPFKVYDSSLSEMGVLGFEYGFSVEHPRALVMWEAQFGDFANGAQIIVDQFLATAEDKWGQRSRLVMLLPHGYEGQGPEHSSARVERFLQLCAGGNLQVACPSTPAQYFHLLRRQAALPVPKPLVILTPKSLLRHPRCVSAASDLVEGRFAEVLDDPAATPGAPRLVLAAGKLHYDLMAEREARGREDLVLARVEQFYPWPKEAIAALLDRHGRTRDVVWAQEEPRNMGGWAFVEPRLRSMLPAGATLTFVGRPPSPSPATGSHRRHVAEQDAIVKAALGA